MSYPSNTDGVAQDQIRAFFERWQRLEEDKQAVSENLKELFAEAKGYGFDTKALRAVFRDKTKDHAEREEFEAVYELYWNALGTVNANARDARDEPADPDHQDVAADAEEASAPVSSATQSSVGRQAVGSERLKDQVPSKGADTAGSNPAPRSNVTALRSVVLRPYCQRQDDLTKCDGYGKVHCHECEKLRVSGGMTQIPHQGSVA